MTVNGNGRVILAGGATLNGTWTQTSGILQINSATSLGATAASAPITVTGGILAGGAAVTIANPITLGGGTLAGGIGAAGADLQRRHHVDGRDDVDAPDAGSDDADHGGELP